MGVQMSRRDHVVAEVKRLAIVIFECRYSCRIMQRDQYDIETLENRGIPVTGIEWLDNINDESHVSRLLTIEKMCEYATKGVNFWLDDPSSYSGIIYKACVDYITYYAELSDMYPNLQIPDQEDFEALDLLARNMYKLYRCYETELDTATFMGRLRARRRGFDINHSTVSRYGKPLTDEEGVVPQKEHKSNLTLFGHRYQPRKEPTNDD